MNRRNFLVSCLQALAVGSGRESQAGGAAVPGGARDRESNDHGKLAAGGRYDGIISVDRSGRLVNGAGSPVMLRGMNVTGLEGQLAARGWLSNPWGNMSADGSQPTGVCGPDWPAIARWKPNCIRIPLNALSFLNVTCGQLSWGGSLERSVWSQTYAADPNGVYRSAVLQAIQGARSIGCYVILDCHMSAPRFTLAGATHFLGSANQNPALDYDSGYLFWCDPTQSIVAWLLKSLGGDPKHGSTGIGDVIFELFNEPYLNAQAWTLTKCNPDGSDSGVRAPATATTNAYAAHVQGCEFVMLHGGWCNWFYQQGLGAPYGIPSGFTSPPNASAPSSAGGLPNALPFPWRILGYQEALGGIRAQGANNVICCNPSQWANLQSTARFILPSDTLPVPQLAIGWHTYPTVYSSGSATPASADDGPTWYSAADANIAGNGGVGRPVPTILDEWGDVSGPDALQPSRYDQQIQDWADRQPIGMAHVAHFNWTGPNAGHASGTYRWALDVLGPSFSFAGSISGTTLTVSSISDSLLAPGIILQSSAQAGTYIVSQASGTPGGRGEYIVSIAQSVPRGTTFTAAPVLPWNGDGLTVYQWMVNHP